MHVSWYCLSKSLDPTHIVSEHMKCLFGHTVLILDVKPEIGAHVLSDHCYLICLRHLVRSTAIADMELFPKKNLFLSHVRNVF